MLLQMSVWLKLIGVELIRQPNQFISETITKLSLQSYPHGLCDFVSLKLANWLITITLRSVIFVTSYFFKETGKLCGFF